MMDYHHQSLFPTMLESATLIKGWTLNLFFYQMVTFIKDKLTKDLDDVKLLGLLKN